jgi:alkanesulfonate monooxygenase SsuD/methylene tetrahydromethanopterin reductase-like flavin-dependent oxidoreductase (luciferase family)
MRLVQEAEQLGFDHYYLIEHQSSPGLRATSAVTILAAMTQNTSIIRLGAMIFPLPFHNPMRLAQDAATIDQLSNGRLEFGTGIGTTEAESVRWGIDYDERQAMGEEALRIIQLAWSQDTVTYDGKYWQFKDHLVFPRPFQQPHPPIWVGCHSWKTHEFAARNSLGCATNIDTDEDIADNFALYRKVWSETHPPTVNGRTFLMRQVYVDDTDAKAHDVARGRYLNTWGKMNRGLTEGQKFTMHREESEELHLNPSGYGSHDTVDLRRRTKVRETMAGPNGYEWALDNGIFIVGSPDTVAESIRRTSDRLDGLDVFCANFEFGGMSIPQTQRSMEMFGEYVRPALTTP